MRQSQNYKSPLASMLWSAVLPGFGQLYNKEYVLGIVLIGLELLINLKSHLNLTILYSFHCDLKRAHDVINYQWGMFYPSFYSFSLWQAYNHAKTHNFKINELKQTRTYLSGLFIGMAIGMNLGLYWHYLHFLSQYHYLKCLDIPLFNGLLFGLFGALLGNFMEKKFYRKGRKNKRDAARQGG